MDLFLYNSYTRKKQIFIPVKDDSVTMYACGPTVYGPGHIGNGRSAIVFDTLARVLRYKYKNLIYVRNITDVDDKIINTAKEEKVETSFVTKKFTEEYHNDFARLHVLPPDIEPYATDHITQMIDFIKILIKNGNAYFSESHCFSEDYPYGELSGRKTEDMIPGCKN